MGLGPLLCADREAGRPGFHAGPDDRAGEAGCPGVRGGPDVRAVEAGCPGW